MTNDDVGKVAFTPSSFEVMFNIPWLCSCGTERAKRCFSVHKQSFSKMTVELPGLQVRANH